jgi:gliding motility-associated-like protein
VGQQIQLDATGSSNLYWIADPTLDDPDAEDPFVTPQEPTTYYAIDFNDCETDTVAITVDIYIPETSITENTTICIGSSVDLEATGGVTYSWVPTTYLSDTDIPNPVSVPDETITYTVSIVTADGCEVFEQVTITVETNAPGGIVYDDIDMCQGSTAQLMAANGFLWNWSPAATLNNPNIQDPLATPSDTTTYFVTITNSCGTGTDQVTVNVIYPGVSAFGGGTICYGQYAMAWATGADEYQWQPSMYAFPPDNDTTWLSPPESMEFTVTGLDDNGCGASNSVWVYVLPLPPVSAGPDQHIEYTDAAQLYGNAFGLEYNWSPADGLSCTDCPYPVATPDSTMYYYLTVTDHNGCSNTDSVLVQLYFPIYVPNTITANGDGINDYFRAYGENITGFHMQIFDRWGFMVFESYDINEAWDGGIDGYYVQNDSYVWVISFDSIDRRKELVGHVNVVR